MTTSQGTGEPGPCGAMPPKPVETPPAGGVPLPEALDRIPDMLPRHALPMVRSLYENPSVPWTYKCPAPDLLQRHADVGLQTALRQLAVAIGGAVSDLPTQVPPQRL